MQTVPERKKWGVYFELKGCISCHTRERSHGANGFCSACYPRIFAQLKTIVSELMQERSGEDENARRYLRPLQHGE